MSFCDRLKERREYLTMGRSELGAKVGVTASAIGNYENGVSFPKEEILYKLFDVLQVEPNYLWQDEMAHTPTRFDVSYAERDRIKKYRVLDGHGKDMVDTVLDKEHERCMALKAKRERARSQTEESVYYFPSYDSPMSAGTGLLAGQEYPKLTPLVKEPPHGASYIAPVRGDSMEPTYSDGDLLFIHATPDIEPGQIGVFLMGGEQYVKELGDGELISHNEEYEPIPMTEDIICQGLVLGVCDESYFE